MEKKPKRKTGRPSIYSDALAARICAQLARGRSLRSVCRDEAMPGLDTIFRWLHEKPEFQVQYARAKAESADALVDEMLDICDDGSNDYVDDGEGGVKLNAENVQRSRLRVDTRKWIASKLKPRVYGERLDMNHGVQPENPLAVLIRDIQGSSIRPVHKRHEGETLKAE